MTDHIGHWRATYTPGSWVVLSGPTAMVVLQPAPAQASGLINSMWDAVLAGTSIHDVARRLADFNIDRMPSFAAFFWGAGQMRSLVRGRIQVMDLASGQYVADGAGVQTWHEVGLGDLRQFRIDMEGSPEDSLDQLQLPLVVGAVTAAAVVLDASEEALVRTPQVGELAGDPTGGAGVEESVPRHSADHALPDHPTPDLRAPHETVPAAAAPDETVSDERAPSAPAPDEGVPDEGVPDEGVPDGAGRASREPDGPAASVRPAYEVAKTEDGRRILRGDGPDPALAFFGGAGAGEDAADPSGPGESGTGEGADEPADDPGAAEGSDTPPRDSSVSWDGAVSGDSAVSGDRAAAEDAGAPGHVTHPEQTGPAGPDPESAGFAPGGIGSAGSAPVGSPPASPFGAPPVPDEVPSATPSPLAEPRADVGHPPPGGPPAGSPAPARAVDMPSHAAPWAAPGRTDAPPGSGAPADPRPMSPSAAPPSWSAPPSQQSLAPHGQTPHGQTPYGQAPAGQAPAGQAPAGQTPYGQTPHGPPPAGPVDQAPPPAGPPSWSPPPGPRGPEQGTPGPPPAWSTPSGSLATGPAPARPFADPVRGQGPPPWADPAGPGAGPLPTSASSAAPVAPSRRSNEPSGVPAGPARPAPAPVPEEAVDHDGSTVFATSLARSLKSSDPGRSGSDLVLAALCTLQHPNPPQAQQCSRCGGPVPPQNPRLVTRPVLATLRPSSGESVDVDRAVRIGRAPSATRVAQDAMPRLMTVPSPSHDISRTHVEVEPDGWNLRVTDQHSTNGTTLVITGPEPERRRLVPGEPAELRIGWFLDLGDGVTIRVDRPAG